MKLMKKGKNKGFTLVELMIVIVIIGILSAILIPTISNAVEESRMKAAQSETKSIYTEIVTNLAASEYELPTIMYMSKVVGSNEYHCKLTNGSSENIETIPEEFTHYTMVKGIKIWSQGATVSTGNDGYDELPSAEKSAGWAQFYGPAYKPDSTFKDDNTYDNRHKVVYFKLGKIDNISSATLEIINEDGEEVYNYTKDKNVANVNMNRFMFSAFAKQFVDGEASSLEDAVKDGNAMNNSTREQAIGWYTYTLTITTETEGQTSSTNTDTYTGVFYYDGQ